MLRGKDFDFRHNGTGYPELSFHGLTPWQLDEEAPTLTFACLFAEDHGKYGLTEDCFIYIPYNAHWEEHDYTLPVIPAGMRWHLAFDSAGFSSVPGKEPRMDDAGRMKLAPRSCKVLVGKRINEI